MKIFYSALFFAASLFFCFEAGAQDQEVLYARVIRPGTSIRENYTDPRSPILGMVKRGDVLPIVTEGTRWCKVEYGETTGWIDKQHIEIITTQSSFVVRDATIVLVIILTVVLVVLLISAVISVRYVREYKKRSVYVEKNLLIIAREKKVIQYVLTGEEVSLENCFKEIGFAVRVASTLKQAEQFMNSAIPDLVLIDWQISPATQTQIEDLFTQRPTTSSAYFIFYNVPHDTKSIGSNVLPNTDYLGTYFSDRDIFKFVTPLIITEERPKLIRKSVEKSALEGSIEAGSLLEVLQFIEIGRKMGCLMVDCKTPFGLLYFQDGQIIYASTSKDTGKEAVFSMLNLKAGTFRFILNKQPKAANTRISTLEVLMEWTKEFDETHGN